MENLKEKIKILKAKKIISKLNGIEFKRYENIKNTIWNKNLNDIYLLDSMPLLSISLEEKIDFYIWTKENIIKLLNNSNEWIINIPDCDIWLNIVVNDVEEVIKSIWDNYENHEFVILDKINLQILCLFSEEKNYEIYLKKI